MVLAPAILVPLLLLVTFFLAYALAQLIVAILRAVAGVLHDLPAIGGYLAGKVEGMAQSITNVLYRGFTGTEALIGTMWHALARWLEREWHEIESQAALALQQAQALADLIYSHTGVQSIVRRLERTFTGIEHGVKTLTREYHGIDRRVAKLEHELARGIGNDVRVQVAGLEGEVTHLENKVIPSIRSAAQTAEADLTAFEQYVRANYLSLAGEAVTAAVLTALGSLGLGGLRCNSLLNSLRNRGCGLWSGLEDLLGLFIDALLFTNFCDLWAVLTPLFQEVLDPVVGLIAGFADGACSHPPSSFASFSVTEGGVPPPQTIGSRPS